MEEMAARLNENSKNNVKSNNAKSMQTKRIPAMTETPESTFADKVREIPEKIKNTWNMMAQRIGEFIINLPEQWCAYAVLYSGSGQSISKKAASQSLPNSGGITMYQGEERWILMSRMYYWAQAFKERYPNDMKVYYESEDFVCYVMPQNMYHQYNFAIDYGYNQFQTQEDKN
mgnify:CR=1 FL=1